MKAPSETINAIVNHLVAKEPIPISLIDQGVSFGNTKNSCYMGLAALIYNRSLIAKETTNVNIATHGIGALLNIDAQMKAYNVGDILLTRGEILKQFGKFLEPVLPAPACYLARFDYQRMSTYCDSRGESIMRHMRGIYPVIDTEDIPPLQFLPYYEYLQETNLKMLLGNRNWKLARQVVEAYYIKRVVPFCPTLHPRSEDPGHLGMRLAYIMFLGKQDEMKQYLSILEQTFLEDDELVDEEVNKENSQLINRFKFWLINYFAFLEEGLDIYVNGNRLSLDASIPLLHCASTGVWGLEQKLLEVLSRVMNVPIESKELQMNLIPENFEGEFEWIVRMVTKGITCPQVDYDPDSFRMMLLAIIHKSMEALHCNQQKPALEAFQSFINRKSPKEEPYYRVFYTDEQIIKLYQNNTLKLVPTEYDFGPTIMSDIVHICLRNNERDIVTNIKALSILSDTQQLQKLTSCTLIGVPKSQSTPSGADILQILSSRKQIYIPVVLKELKQPAEAYENYLKNWSLYYRCVDQKFDTAVIQELLKGSIGPKSLYINLQGPEKSRSAVFNLSNMLLKHFRDANAQYDRLINTEIVKDLSQRQQERKVELLSEIQCYQGLMRNEKFVSMLEWAEAFTQSYPIVEDLWSELSISIFLLKEGLEDKANPDKGQTPEGESRHGRLLTPSHRRSENAFNVMELDD